MTSRLKSTQEARDTRTRTMLRNKYKKGYLTQEQIETVEKIPGWRWDYTKTTLESSIVIAQALVKEYGSLPFASKLVKMGHKPLVVQMMNNPQHFLHFPKDPPGRSTRLTDAEAIYLLETMVANNKGNPLKLGDIQKIHPRVYNRIKYKPSIFEHIQITSRKSIKDHVMTAKVLCKNHKGLPRTTWLVNNGFIALVGAINRHPQNFVNILRQPKTSKWSK